MRAIAVSILGLLAALALALPAAHAESLESVIMPGKVIAGHADLEGGCKNCHMRFNKSAQTGLCLDCHKDVNADVMQKQGYHGRLSERECRTCHTDHKGREANIAPVDTKTFDHKLTDFALRGGHLAPKIECRNCHPPKKKFREAPTSCNSCHKKDDKHKGSLGTSCADCHVERNWKEVKFDHAKTQFPLLGKHGDVQCKECHADPKFKGAPTQCNACHKKDDRHKGRYGVKCESCHTEKDWKGITFNHDRDTKYKLLGNHRQAKCDGCHTGPSLFNQKLSKACVACHKKNDAHKTRFGEKCESCHVERDWKSITFDHDRDTKYQLVGKHATANCDSCHKGSLFRDKLKTNCFSCHEKDDKHKGQEGKQCENCHNERKWTDTRFDHGLARFPLLGKHARVECKECHRTPVFKDTETACSACHQKADTHKRRLGPKCEMCHNARDWKLWNYDHDRRTRFRLDGGHKGITCEACHKRPVDGAPTLAGTCASCHEDDDVHDTSFGKQCERCHLTPDWKKLRPGVGMSR